MEKCENIKPPPSLEYDAYTAEYINSLFTLFNPLQSHRYPMNNASYPHIHSWKSQVTQSALSSQSRQNAARYLLDFHHAYSENFSPFMIEVLRNLPARNRRVARSWNYTHKKRTPDYWELNQKRPSVIRRSIKSNSKCSSPREAILETNFAYEKNPQQTITPITPKYTQSDHSFIHKDPHLSTKDSLCTSPDIPNSPQREASVIHKGVHLLINDPRTIHQIPQQDHQKSSVISSRVRFIPNSTERNFETLKDKKDHLEKVLELRNYHEVQATQCLSADSTTDAATSDKNYEKVGMKAFPVSSKNSNPTLHESFCKTRKVSESDSRQYEQDDYIGGTRIWSKSVDGMKQDREYIEETKKEQLSSPVIQLESYSDKQHKENGISLKTHKTEPTTQGGNIESPKRDQKYKFYCSHCKKRFRWFSHWQAHERTHTGERPFKCTQCDRCFTRGDGLQAHMVIHSTKKPHKCSTCLKVFARKPMLERHILEHTGVVPYKCEVCEVEMFDPGDIVGHLARHEKQRTLTCQYCSKCFSSAQRLVKHIRAHTGEKPFPCTQCTMRFCKKSALEIHKRVHSGDKPFPCPNCGKSFSISGNLRRHILIHTGERPYSCTRCKKRFNNKSHLARHVSSQHGNQ